MVSPLFLLFLLAVAADRAESPAMPLGSIQGVVEDGTHPGSNLAGVDVILRASMAGELVPVGQTQTDRYGRFSFDGVPLDRKIVYLPGANRDGVHYPGKRLQLDTQHPIADVQIVAYSAVDTPCPLVAERHELDLSVEGQTLVVSETLRISNPSLTTFVGQPMGGGVPVTFWLSIPPDFDRVTFDKEFFGRRFQVIDHKPVTDMPWLPGKQELRFTYRIPLVESEGRFHRPLDIPTEAMHVRITGASANQVICNLPISSHAGPMEYDSTGESLSGDFALDIQFAKLPISWLRNARWIALGLLLTLAAATYLAYRRKPALVKATGVASAPRRAA